VMFKKEFCLKGGRYAANEKGKKVVEKTSKMPILS